MRRLAALLALVAALAAAPAAHAVDYARANRLGVTLGFGFGSAAMGRIHDMMETSLQGVKGPTSGLQINAEIGFRYYFPFHLLAQVGCGAIYNRASENYPGFGDFINHNLTMEVPILVGGYFSLIGRLYLYGAVGPSIFFYARSWNDGTTDFKAPGGAAFHALVGADFLAGEHFSVGLELRFRYLKTGDLSVLNDPQDRPVVDATGQTFNLDFTGITLGLNLRFFAL
jgi:opacity protein-like surface antigen